MEDIFTIIVLIIGFYLLISRTGEITEKQDRTNRLLEDIRDKLKEK